jgi:predicted extracellular nuclease
MTTVRVATFNVENLFARYRFESNIDPMKAVQDGWRADQTAFKVADEDEKRITAQAIKALKADVLALQEVENLDTLRRFRNTFLGGRKIFPYAVAIDGNDPRLIDVAVLSAYPIIHVRSYQHQANHKGDLIFSRDCLEVDILLPNGVTLTLFVNHLKSMLDKDDPCNGRRNTCDKRMAQAREVKKIITSRFGTRAGRKPFIVLGDMNDYVDTDEQGETGIAELVGWSQLVNVVDRMPPEERWTHFFKGNRSCKIAPSYHQLDYLLLSKSLATANPHAPQIERRGMPKRADRYTGPRFEGIGTDNPKASDHCPVWMDITVGK